METGKEQQHEINKVLNEIFSTRGFNFREYGITHIQQKLSGRMSILEISDLNNYLQYIKFNPEEYISLFDCLLVNQNQFFRDPEVYDFIGDHILPKLLSNTKDSNKQEIRIWSVGCASGEEPYSVAILLSEVLKNDLGKYKNKNICYRYK